MDASDAKKIREAVAYLKAMTLAEGDEMAQWADGEVMDAAGKYADYLETRDARPTDAAIETAARAIYMTDYERTIHAWELLHPSYKEPFLRRARAALEATYESH